MSLSAIAPMEPLMDEPGEQGGAAPGKTSWHPSEMGHLPEAPSPAWDVTQGPRRSPGC